MQGICYSPASSSSCVRSTWGIDADDASHIGYGRLWSVSRYVVMKGTGTNLFASCYSLYPSAHLAKCDQSYQRWFGATTVDLWNDSYLIQVRLYAHKLQSSWGRGTVSLKSRATLFQFRGMMVVQHAEVMVHIDERTRGSVVTAWSGLRKYLGGLSSVTVTPRKVSILFQGLVRISRVDLTTWTFTTWP